MFYPLDPKLTLKRILLIVSIVLALLCMAAPAFAQATEGSPSTPDPFPTPVVTDEAPVEPPVIDPLPEVPDELPLIDVRHVAETLLLALVGTIGASLAGGGLGPVVTAVVGFLKNIVPASVISANGLNVICSLVIWVIIALATRLGIGYQVRDVLGILAQMLPLVYGLIASIFSAKKTHELAAERGFPLLGDKRTPELHGVQAAFQSSVSYAWEPSAQSAGVNRSFTWDPGAQSQRSYVTHDEMDGYIDRFADAVVAKQATLQNPNLG